MATVDSGTDPLSIIPPTSTQALVDPTRGASRHSLSPIEWNQRGAYGHYRAAHASGTTVSLAAGAHVAGVRWAPVGATSAFMIVTGVRVGYVVTSAITTATPVDLRLMKAEAFTVDFSSNNTQLDLSGTKMSMMRPGTMAQSLLLTKGPSIATTAAMAGQTATVDTNPIGIAVWPGLTAVTATGTAVAMPAGAGGVMQDLFYARPGHDSPLILANNEGLIVQNVTAGPTTGGIKYYVEWTWTEALGY